MKNNYDKFKIQSFEEDHDMFTCSGLDILSYIKYKNNTSGKEVVVGYKDYSGDYYKGARSFFINGEQAYNKKCFVTGTAAEVFLGYAYNEIGIDSPIYYPYFMRSYLPKSYSGVILPDGVISKDITVYFGKSMQTGNRNLHTLNHMANSKEGQELFSREGVIEKIKDTIISLAFNNKDSGYGNLFWVKTNGSDKYNHIISIDHGYCGRDSLFADTKEGVINGLYFKGEHGYNGMYYDEEDRKSTLQYINRLLNGEKVGELLLTDKEIIELKDFIVKIKQLSFNEIASYLQDKFQWKTYPKFIYGMEYSREDMCNMLDR